MAEMLGVSRETWRKALGLLRGEGVLYSRHGSGTYLQEPSHRITNDLSQLKSMSKMIAEAGLREQGLVHDLYGRHGAGGGLPVFRSAGNSRVCDHSAYPPH